MAFAIFQIWKILSLGMFGPLSFEGPPCFRASYDDFATAEATLLSSCRECPQSTLSFFAALRLAALLRERYNYIKKPSGFRVQRA